MKVGDKCVWRMEDDYDFANIIEVLEINSIKDVTNYVYKKSTFSNLIGKPIYNKIEKDRLRILSNIELLLFF